MNFDKPSGEILPAAGTERIHRSFTVFNETPHLVGQLGFSSTSQFQFLPTSAISKVERQLQVSTY